MREKILVLKILSFDRALTVGAFLAMLEKVLVSVGAEYRVTTEDQNRIKVGGQNEVLQIRNS